jgi:Tol biopolymer transport system component
VEELFHAALERAPEARQAFLDQACGEDEDLRSQVQFLLTNEEQAGSFLERPLIDEATNTATRMAQMIGRQLGPYRIVSGLGSGGMGEVYRAHDSKLGRDVAIKTLPAEFARDPERMARFRREARTLAALNHPNIAAIYGFEESGGGDYLVMELVDGETLANRLKKGPLPIGLALQHGSQIADALTVAHSKGIVHRDLKPGNIMVTKSGVKVLDFGLAKSRQDGTVTATDAVMGTPKYMAPEQREGKECDSRTDIYALGLVLREMAADFPPQVAHIVERCIADDPDERWQAASDVSKELEWTAQTESGADSLAQANRAPHNRLPWAIATAAVLTAIVVLFLHFRQTPPAERVLRSTIATPEGTTNIYDFAISPDGRFLAIAARANGKVQLWLRALDAPQARAIPGTDDAAWPFWSPDSRYIGFFAQGKLKKIAASGGPAQSLADVPNGQGGSWNRDNVILFSLNGGRDPIKRISAAAGVPADATYGKGISRHPLFLPDGRHFLYTQGGGIPVDQRGVYLGSLDGKDSRRILPDVSSVVFATGLLLFVRDNVLMAQPFDAASGRLRGEAFPVAERVFKNILNHAPVTVSESGLLLYQSGGGISYQIGWYGRDGKSLEAIGASGAVFDAAISPDEKWVAYRHAPGTGVGSDLWGWDLARGAEQRFTTGALTSGPVWSPQGDRIAFDSFSGGIYNLYQKVASGTGPVELLLANGNNKWTSQWSRDGRFIVYTELDPKTKLDIWVLPMHGSERRPIPFLHSESNELLGQLSPDGHWMAYVSDESGQREVYVRPFPVGEGQWKISIGGGDQPRWRGDGGELFFVGGQQAEYDGSIDSIMAVTVKARASLGPGTRASFDAGAPQQLFETHLTSVVRQTD